MKFKKKELFDLYNALHSVGNLSGPRFVYVVARNIAYLKDEVNSLQKSLKSDDAFVEYEKERVELAKKYSLKKDGQPVKYTENGMERFTIEDQVAFDKALSELKTKHQEAIDNRINQERVFETMLEEDTELFLFELKKEDLPEDITADQLSGIICLVTKDADEK